MEEIVENIKQPTTAIAIVAFVLATATVLLCGYYNVGFILYSVSGFFLTSK